MDARTFRLFVAAVIVVIIAGWLVWQVAERNGRIADCTKSEAAHWESEAETRAKCERYERSGYLKNPRPPVG